MYWKVHRRGVEGTVVFKMGIWNDYDIVKTEWCGGGGVGVWKWKGNAYFTIVDLCEVSAE